MGAVPKFETRNTEDLLGGLQQLFNKTLASDLNGNKQLGDLIKSKQHDHLDVAPHREGNIIYCDPIQKANILNRQFISVFTDDTKTSLPDLGHSQYPSMEDITASCEGVVKLLKILKPHKAAVPDDIPLMLLKEAADEITLLFQASLNQGNNPSTWRKALVVSISKKSSKSDASNYRPISLTSVLCKLCEHIPNSTILLTTKYYLMHNMASEKEDHVTSNFF